MLLDEPTANAAIQGAGLAIIALLWVILLVRVVGLRSFSKMTSFDFVMTIAMGSLVGSASRSTELTEFVQSLAAMAGLFAIQFLIARFRKTSTSVGKVIQNEPLLLVRDGQVIETALKQSRVSVDDLRAKLRAANVLDLREVRAAVLETTGDMSILHGDHLDEILLEGVRTVG